DSSAKDPSTGSKTGHEGHGCGETPMACVEERTTPGSAGNLGILGQEPKHCGAQVFETFIRREIRPTIR
ncbi:MAG: hypothetical protein ACXWMH_03590, partial [Syntrophales bacterium]